MPSEVAIKTNLILKTNRKYKKTTYKCNCAIDCEASFSTFNSFQSHCLEKHKMFPLECKICKRRYKEQATFKNHLETHQGVLKYECDNCSKKFVTKERLFAHRRLHLSGKTLPCPSCDFKARSGKEVHESAIFGHFALPF